MRHINICRIAAVALLSAVLSAIHAPASAQTSFTHALSFQGRLCATDGKPLPDGPYNVTFSMYSMVTAGTPLWTETQNVVQMGGVFSTYLGLVTPFPSDLFSSGNRWLGIKVGSDPEMSHRCRLTPSPWAIQAASADTATTADLLDGHHGAFYQNANNLTSGTLLDARLSSNVALLDNPQAFTALKTFNAGIATNTLAVAGNAIIGGTLGVAGTTTLTGALAANGGIATTALTTSGPAVLNNLAVTNNTAVGGTLSVTGLTTLSNLGVMGDLAVNGALAVADATLLMGNVHLGDGLIDALNVYATSEFNAPVTFENDVTFNGNVNLVSLPWNIIGNGENGWLLAADNTSGVNATSICGVNTQALAGDYLVAVRGDCVLAANIVPPPAGFKYGGYFQSGNVGVLGYAIGDTTSRGVWGRVDTASATGVYAENTAGGVALRTTGLSAFGGAVAITTGGLSVAGPTSLTGNLTASGNATVHGDLDVKGATTLRGNMALGDAAADTIAVLGTTTFVGSGVTTTFSGNISIGGTLTANGAGLTHLNASNLTSGTVADARLSSNVDLLDVSQTITANKYYSGQVRIGTGAAGVPLSVGNDSNNNSSLAFCAIASGTGTGQQISAVYGETRNTATTNAGAGVYGFAVSSAGASAGVRGVANGQQGIGVHGAAYALSGVTYGVKAMCSSPSGYAGYFEGRGYFSDKVGIGDSAPSSALTVLNGDISTPAVSVTHTATGSDESPAILGTHNTTDFHGTGVKGIGGYAGVLGIVTPTGNRDYMGVYGQVDGGTGTNYGVRGRATGGECAVGVYGSANGGSSSSYAGYFTGDVYITGTLSKGGGSFKIDHPLDPENKYLSHSFVESPDMMNIYNGDVTTDDRGYATVTMPDWFDALNRDFRYQLTVIDDGDSDEFVMAKVVRRIEGNQFTIRTSAPHITVSWQVTGIRQDAYANKHRIPLEEDKTPRERGKYLHPDAYGQPEESGIGRLPEMQQPNR